MYTRELTAPPSKLVIDGKPQFGTFFAPPKRFDISDVRQPFAGPLFPSFISNMRIRATVTFSFSIGTHIGLIHLFDAKFLCFSEIVLWEKESGRRIAYRNLFGLRRLIPKNMEKSVCSTFRKKRYIRIGWNRAKERITVHFTMIGDSTRPSLEGTFILNTSPNGEFLKPEVFSLAPAPTKRRCNGVYVCAAPLKGGIIPYKTPTYGMFSQEGLGMFAMRRAYHRLHTKASIVMGMDTLNGQKVLFRLAHTSYDAVDANGYNENALFVDSAVTPLPPVTITRPYGATGKWIIQDTENMVDLFFTPISDCHRNNSIVVLRTDYHTIYGFFEGDLKTKDGETLHLKNFSGLARKETLRM